jgi:hypothetical protein
MTGTWLQMETGAPIACTHPPQHGEYASPVAVKGHATWFAPTAMTLTMSTMVLWESAILAALGLVVWAVPASVTKKQSTRWNLKIEQQRRWNLEKIQ